MTLIYEDPKPAADIYIAAGHSKLPPELLIAALADKTSLRYTLATGAIDEDRRIPRSHRGVEIASAMEGFVFPEIYGESGS